MVYASVQKTVGEYFAVSIGKFAQILCRPNFLTAVDDSDPSLLSSRVEITLKKRIIPVLTLSKNQNATFSAALKSSENLATPVVRSGFFRFQN